MHIEEPLISVADVTDNDKDVGESIVGLTKVLELLGEGARPALNLLNHTLADFNDKVIIIPSILIDEFTRNNLGHYVR